jgi:hypothetical protein
MRKALRVEPTQVINPLLTAKSMRELTNTYLRHTIKRPIRPHQKISSKGQNLESRARATAADYFFIFCRQIVPQIEERVEMQLLEKFKTTLKSDLERKEVEAAWFQRKDNLAKIPEREEPGEPEPKKPRLFIPKDEYYNVIQTIHGDGLSYHTY